MTAPGNGFKLAGAWVGIEAKDQTETKISDIKARLQTLATTFGIKADDKSVYATLTLLKGELRRLSSSGPTIQVRVDAAKALAELEGVKLAEGKLDQSSGSAQKSLGLLVTTAATLGPAIVPIAGVALAGAGALGAMGAAGLLAFAGIKNEMKQGTPLGEKYASTISVITGDLHGLEHSAASGLLGPFNAAMAKTHAMMPELNAEMKVYGGLAGNTLGHLLGASISALHTMNPLLTAVSIDIDKGSAAVERWASGPGLQKFSDQVTADLPKVIATFESVAQAGGHIVGALGPLGGESLVILKTISQVISAIPTPLLTLLAGGFILVRNAALGLKVLTTVQGYVTATTAVIKEAGTAYTMEAASFAAGSTVIVGATAAAAEANAAAAAAVMTGSTEMVAAIGLVGDSADLTAGQYVAASALIEASATAMAEAVATADASIGVVSAAMAGEVTAADAEIIAANAATTVSARAAGISMAASWTAALGPVGLLAGAAFGIGELIKGPMSKVPVLFGGTSKGFDAILGTAKNAKDITKSFTDVLEQSGGVVDASVVSAAKLAITQNGLAESTAKSGLTLDDLSAAVVSTDAKSADLIKTWVDQGKITKAQGVQLGLLHDDYTKAATAAADYTKATTENNKALALANPEEAKKAAALGVTQTAYEGAVTALNKKIATDTQNLAMQKLEIEQNYQLMGTQDQLSKKYGITTTQVQDYAAKAGVTQKMVTDGTITQEQYNAAVNKVVAEYQSANTAQRGLLDATDAWNTSLKTSVDKAALIGATLKASNGDMLSYSTSMNAMATTTQSFEDSITQEADTWSKTKPLTQAQIELNRRYVASIYDSKTGTIDFNNAAAGPFISGLQSMQDAAEKGTEALYLHEVGTKGDAAATKDATSYYLAHTSGALIDQHGKLTQTAIDLGLTKTEAQKLNETYFDTPTSVLTKISQSGADPVLTALNQIGQDLAILTGTTWTPVLSLDAQQAYTTVDQAQKRIDDIKQGKVPGLTADNARGKAEIARLQAQIDGVRQKHIPGVNVDKAVADQKTRDLQARINAIKQGKVPGLTANNAAGKQKIADLQAQIDGLHGKTVDLVVQAKNQAMYALLGHQATGGWINGPGTTTSDSVPIMASNDEFMVNAAQAKKWGPLLEAINSGTNGYAAGGLIQKYATGGKVTAAQRATQVAAERLLLIRLDVGDTRSILSHLFGSVSSLAGATKTMLLDVQKAVSKGMGGQGLVTVLNRENNQLLAEATKRASVASKLKAAQATLVADQKLFADERTAVAQAVSSSFDITSAGAGSSGGSTERLIQQLKYDVADAQSFKTELALLQKEGLNKTLLKQLAEGGPNSANALALKTASVGQVKQINSLYGTLSSTANSTGTAIATDLYGAGIKAAQGLVKGLQSQEKTLEKQMSHLASVMVNQIKHDLKIHSPSEVGHELGSYFGQGIDNGLASQHSKIAQTASKYGTAMSGIGGSSGTNAAVHIEHVHVHVDHLDDVEHLKSIIHGLPMAVRAGVAE